MNEVVLRVASGFGAAGGPRGRRGFARRAGPPGLNPVPEPP